MSSSFHQAPKLPREPTLIRDASLSAKPVTPPPLASTQSPPSPPPFPDAPLDPSPAAPSPAAPSPAAPSPPAAPPPPPPPPPPRRDAPKEIPLPPKFPSIHDEPAWTTAATSPQSAHTPLSAPLSNASPLASAPPPASDASPSQPVHDVSWNRASSDNLSASLSQPPVPPEHAVNEQQHTGLLATIVAMFKRPKPPAVDSAPPASPTKPPLQKVKDVVCKLPDPTLIFVLHASVILLLHTFVPHVLRSWPARIVIPLVLVPTVAATALWRRTIVIAKPGTSVLSLVKPIPNAGKVVSMGETLRAREAAVIAAEDNVKEGQMRLEMLRKEIESRLPPQESITTLLESDQRAQDDSS